MSTEQASAFEKWLRETSDGCSTSEREFAKAAWNGAIEEVIKVIKQNANSMYSKMVDMAKTPLCEGAEFKLENGRFSKKELEAHREVSKLFGAHLFGFDVIRQLRGTLQ